MELEKEKSKESRSKDIFLMFFLQIFVLFLGTVLYQQIAKIQIQTALSLKSSVQSSAKLKDVSGSIDQGVAWNEPASVEKALRDYNDFIVLKRPWLLAFDRIVWAFCFILPAYIVIRKIANIEIADFGDTYGTNTFFTGTLIGFATFCFVNVIGGLIFFFVGKPQPTYLETLLTQNLQGNWNLLFWALVSVSFGAGIFEEIFFRGFILKYFIEKDYSIIGLLITSVIFGAVHITPERSFIGPILLAFVGFSFGLSYIKTGNIWVPITAHISYNSSMLFAAFFLGNRVV